MKAPRKPARTKLTANNKILGRRVKRSGAELPPVEPAKRPSVELPPVEPEKPRLKRYFVRRRGPDYLRDPVTDEPIARRFGPGVPVFEMREPVMGRPPVESETEILRIIQACRVEELERQATDGRSALRQEAEAIYSRKGGQSVLAIEQQLRRTLGEMKERRTNRTELRSRWTARKAGYRWVIYNKK